LTQLTATLRQVKKLYNSTIEIEGVLLTMFDARLNLTAQVLEQVKRFYGNAVYKTTIPRNVRLSEAPSHGMPINLYDSRSTGAESYRLLAAEVMSRGEDI
ncbi:MAG: ParA family protein, partial [Hungatella sp.]